MGTDNVIDVKAGILHGILENWLSRKEVDLRDFSREANLYEVVDQYLPHRDGNSVMDCIGFNESIMSWHA